MPQGGMYATVWRGTLGKRQHQLFQQHYTLSHSLVQPSPFAAASHLSPLLHPSTAPLPTVLLTKLLLKTVIGCVKACSEIAPPATPALLLKKVRPESVGLQYGAERYSAPPAVMLGEPPLPRKALSVTDDRQPPFEYTAPPYCSGAAVGGDDGVGTGR